MASSSSAREGEVAAPSPWVPDSDADREAVREQVGRILASALFRNSKRFPAFLQHTVEHALSRSDGGLKERTIGHEVFGRDAAYDTAQDPIVRMTAAEVRRRLAQYYQAPEHRGEILIAFQPGSYVPEFVPPPPPTEAVEQAPDAAPLKASPRRGLRRAAAAAIALTGIGLVVLSVAAWRHWSVPARAIDQFWAPIESSDATVLLCIGDPRLGSAAPPESHGVLTTDEFLRRNAVRFTDSVTLALLASELRARHKPFRIRRPASTDLDDLRDGPVVLIGGFNNPWTVRFSQGLRFTLASEEAGNYVRDELHPENRTWQLGPGSTTAFSTIHQTYGVISRVFDPRTGNTVVMTAGLVLGTRGAGECLVQADCLESARQLAPGDWMRQNVQIVVATEVIGEDSGPPKVVAAHVW